MGLFDKGKSEKSSSRGIVDYGRNKPSGGHDHRSNRGDDRTPSQKSGDEKRRK